MSEPTAPTEIANLALDILKVENIQDVEMPAGDSIAEVLNRWWDVSKKACLEGFPWNFASKRITLPLVNPPPAFGYPDAYLLPVDYVSLNFIMDESYPLSQWQYTVEGNHLLINNSGAVSVNIGYVFNSDDVAKWSSAFKIYVAYQLAFFTVFKLTGQSGIASAVEKKLAPVRMNAKAVNGLQSPPKAYRQSLMSRARARYGGRNRFFDDERFI